MHTFIILLLVCHTHMHIQWQRQQVEKYCRKYGREGVQYQFPPTTEYVVRQNLFRHLLFDDTRHLIFCFIPKVQIRVCNMCYIATKSRELLLFIALL